MYFYVEPLNNISVGVIKSTFIYGKKKIIKKNAHFCYDSELLRTLSSCQGKNNLVLFDTGCLVLSGKYLSDLGTGPCRQCLDVFLTFLLMELSEDNKLCSTVSYHPPVSGSLLMMRVCDYCTGTEVLLEPLMCGRALSWRWDVGLGIDMRWFSYVKINHKRVKHTFFFDLSRFKTWSGSCFEDSVSAKVKKLNPLKCRNGGNTRKSWLEANLPAI